MGPRWSVSLLSLLRTMMSGGVPHSSVSLLLSSLVTTRTGEAVFLSSSAGTGAARCVVGGGRSAWLAGGSGRCNMAGRAESERERTFHSTWTSNRPELAVQHGRESQGAAVHSNTRFDVAGSLSPTRIVARASSRPHSLLAPAA